MFRNITVLIAKPGKPVLVTADGFQQKVKKEAASKERTDHNIKLEIELSKD